MPHSVDRRKERTHHKSWKELSIGSGHSGENSQQPITLTLLTGSPATHTHRSLSRHTCTAARSPSLNMSGVRKNEATKCFEQLWGNDSHAWNHDQGMVAAGVYALLQETTTITESNLMSRIDTLVNQNPEACAAERASGSSRSVLTTNLRLPLYLGERTDVCCL